MKRYIDKTTVVAEIVRKINLCKKILLDIRSRRNKDYYQGKSEAYKEMLSFLDTLETKEANLEKEAERFVQTKEFVESKESPVLVVAKHFYELGLAQKGEEV